MSFIIACDVDKCQTTIPVADSDAIPEGWKFVQYHTADINDQFGKAAVRAMMPGLSVIMDTVPQDTVLWNAHVCPAHEMPRFKSQETERRIEQELPPPLSPPDWVKEVLEKAGKG